MRKYHSGEDRSWPPEPVGEIGFAVHENPDGRDVVFWQVGHLFHRAAEGEDHWHAVGPSLVVEIHGSTDSDVGPQMNRRVRFQGKTDIQNFKVFKDKWGNFEFDGTVAVNPAAPHAEFVESKSLGDVTATLRMRVDLNGDASVACNFDAQLIDEGEVVAAVSSHFNVTRDASIGWSGLHLVDYHWGDPDTADMEWDATNAQA